jgi:hypothetical protein
MNDKKWEMVNTLRNILVVFQENNQVVGVQEINDTILFDLKTMDVPYKDALIDAGATFDLTYGCWVYWSMEE